jgi:hypothetical protein
MSDSKQVAKKLDAAGWALFFIWVGIALLLDVGWGIGLIGIGLITLAGQGARKYFGLKLEGFWLIVGLLFLVGGIYHVVQVELNLVPILLIIVGVALLVSIFRKK